MLPMKLNNQKKNLENFKNIILKLEYRFWSMESS